MVLPDDDVRQNRCRLRSVCQPVSTSTAGGTSRYRMLITIISSLPQVFRTTIIVELQRTQVIPPLPYLYKPQDTYIRKITRTLTRPSCLTFSTRPQSSGWSWTSTCILSSVVSAWLSIIPIQSSNHLWKHGMLDMPKGSERDWYTLASMKPVRYMVRQGR